MSFRQMFQDQSWMKPTMVVKSVLGTCPRPSHRCFAPCAIPGATGNVTNHLRWEFMTSTAFINELIQTVGEQLWIKMMDRKRLKRFHNNENEVLIRWLKQFQFITHSQLQILDSFHVIIYSEPKISDGSPHPSATRKATRWPFRTAAMAMASSGQGCQQSVRRMVCNHGTSSKAFSKPHVETVGFTPMTRSSPTILNLGTTVESHHPPWNKILGCVLLEIRRPQDRRGKVLNKNTGVNLNQLRRSCVLMNPLLLLLEPTQIQKNTLDWNIRFWLWSIATVNCGI